MRPGRVLVVDDEPEVRLVLIEFLSSRGHEVTAASGGAEAVAMVENTKPDLVLLDVAMPDMDGLEALRRIAAIEPALAVIMVTANADIGITSKLLALGAVDYVPKPFDLDYLDQAVSTQVTAAQDR